MLKMVEKGTISEGLAVASLGSEGLFYNPAQTQNRDLSLLALKAYASSFLGPLSFCDAFAATGLGNQVRLEGLLIRIRAIRSRLELTREVVGEVVACDVHPDFPAALERSLQLSGLPPDSVVGINDDCFAVLEKRAFNVIDIDPFSSPIPYVYKAIRCATSSPQKRGLLCLTFVDSRILFGPQRDSCFHLYGTLRGEGCMKEEVGLRTAVHGVSRLAGVLGKSLKVLFTYQNHYYARAFIEVASSKAECKTLVSKVGNLYSCLACGLQYQHTFCRQSGERNVINPLSPSECVGCKKPLSLSEIISRTSLDSPPIRPPVRWEDARGS